MLDALSDLAIILLITKSNNLILFLWNFYKTIPQNMFCFLLSLFFPLSFSPSLYFLFFSHSTFFLSLSLPSLSSLSPNLSLTISLPLLFSPSLSPSLVIVKFLQNNSPKYVLYFYQSQFWTTLYLCWKSNLCVWQSFFYQDFNN